RGDAGHGAGPGRERRGLDRGRRRQRGRRHADGTRRPHRPRLHGRRGLPGVPGRRSPARRRLPGERVTAGRRYVFAGNWKMYKTVPEAVALAREVRAGLDERPVDDEVVVFPAFTALHAVREALAGSRVGLGAQNMYWEKEGAFTGEVSPPMLKDAGCTHVLLGHSERRHV